MRKYNKAILSLIALFTVTIACSYRYFADFRVYSATPGSAIQFFDSTTDTIIADNVWVFYPEGNFKAVVIVEGKRTTLHGKYGVDNAADNWLISIDVDSRKKFNDHLYLNDSFSYFEWRGDNNVITYYLAP